MNLSHWYSQVYFDAGYVPEHFESWITGDDIDLIARIGFDHVRFPISWEWLFGNGIDSERLDRVVASITQVQAAGLSVIVDAHPEMDYKASLRDDAVADGFLAGWAALAERLRDLPVGRTAIELLNEPSIRHGDRWHRLLRTALGTVRRECPENAVIVCGDGYSELPQLFELPVFDDPGVVYNFHMYDPMIISHQTAHFGDEWVKAVEGLAYPTDADNVREVMSGELPERSHRELEAYLASPWNRDRYREHIAGAVDFANERGVALTCNEYGVYRDAPRSTRLAWLRDVSSALSEAGIGWSVWDYGNDFAVVSGPAGDRREDTEIAEALGLRPRG